MRYLDVKDLAIPDELKKALYSAGITTLFPPQEQAVKKGVLEGESLLVSTPTASGKTLIATMAASIHIKKGGKVLYLTPLRALASEKLAEFKRYLEDSLGAKVVATTGDYDSSDPWLSMYDMVVATNEKLDSLIRHGAEWLKDVTLLIIDEIHVIGDDERGPTLEVTIIKLRKLLPKLQLLALSATVRNFDEIASWLNAKSITSSWRPVPLIEGVYYDNHVEFADGKKINVNLHDHDPIVSLALETYLTGGQALVFAFTRKKSETLAEKIAQYLAPRLYMMEEETVAKLNEYASTIREISERSSFTDKIASLIVRGCAFHHAGLSYQLRKIIEDAFRNRFLKVICSTPTLAAGVNLPARTVIVPEMWRYSAGKGYQPLPILEYKQLAGRGGRPDYDKVGYAISIAKREEEKEILMDKYIKGIPEKVRSKLLNGRHLRTHILALISSRYTNSMEQLNSFFHDTFFCHQYGTFGIRGMLDDTIEFLTNAGFIRQRGKELVATKIGKRVSELYIDPMTALILIDGIKRDVHLAGDVAMLHTVCKTPDIPSIPAFKINRAVIESFVSSKMEELVFSLQEEDYESSLEELRKVIILLEWIDERSEGELYERYGVEPGDLAVLRETTEWVCYSAHQLADVMGIFDASSKFKLMSERVKHGVKEELVKLVSLEGVGRVRARALYDSGFKDIESLASAPLERLASLPSIGQGMALRIKEQVSRITSKGRQSNL